MKKHSNIFTGVIFMSVAITACRKPYKPEVVAEPNSYLVVEGLINSGADSTIIKLNRTVRLSGTSTVNPEKGAAVSVESELNESIQLIEKPNGVYVYPGLNLSTSHQYRLKIRTAGGREYASDFEPVMVAPLIDSLSYKVESNGVSINANTHDPENNTRYYRWEYDETWVYTSTFQSKYKSNGDTVLSRDLINDEIYTCWRSAYSSTIVLGSSAKLSRDVISDAPVTFLSRHSEKIRHKYSALIRQYPLTKGAYEFWVNLKKNTEQLGGIFDVQPSQINGNIHSVIDANEPVIGYVSISNYSSKRIFVDQRKLPTWLDYIDDGCKVEDFIYLYRNPITGEVENQVDEYINFRRATREIYIPLEGITDIVTHLILGYHAALPECVDCTLHGTNKQPSFWQ